MSHEYCLIYFLIKYYIVKHTKICIIIITVYRIHYHVIYCKMQVTLTMMSMLALYTFDPNKNKLKFISTSVSQMVNHLSANEFNTESGIQFCVSVDFHHCIPTFLLIPTCEYRSHWGSFQKCNTLAFYDIHELELGTLIYKYFNHEHPESFLENKGIVFSSRRVSIVWYNTGDTIILSRTTRRSRVVLR